MSPLARTWLRRIALGLPLTAITPLVGCSSGGTSSCAGFTPSERTEHFEVDELTRLRLTTDAGTGGSGCSEVCGDLDRARDGGPGAGFSSPVCDIVLADGGEVLECTFRTICRGRPPAGLLAARGDAGTAIGAFLASAAHLEAASVPAFLDLARELALHGAPRALHDAAVRSARDEVRHARAMAGLASMARAAVPAVMRGPTAPRSFVAMAEDNAIHGCTGEAHAALVAAFQAEHASDPTLRAVWSEIARDEARHALLSASIHDHAIERLGARDARRIEDLRRSAIDTLARASEREDAREVRAAMSLPDADRAVELARALS